MVTVLSDLRAALGDRYDVERELGGGGMSQVFVATERALDRRVVIKVLPPELGQSVNADRFRREIATLATLQHPQIVPIHAAGSAGTLLYYVMPFVTGESLRARMLRDGVFSAVDTVRMVAPLARALAYAHREGIIHRDIKPENVLLAQGEPVLADFGIAKVLRDGTTVGTLTSAGMSIGTVTYMAPEQVLAEPTIDGRADVYSLAVLTWELLAGRPLYDGTAQQVMSAHVVKPAPSLLDAAPAASAALADVLARALAKEPADRYTAAEFAAALESALHAPPRIVAAESAPQATVPEPVHRAEPADRRFVRPAVAVALLVSVAGVMWWRTGRGSERADNRVAVQATGTTARLGIAVLQFSRIGSADDAYLAAGLTDELMTQLAEVPQLRVASSTTVRAFADSTLTPQQLGPRLSVGALVEGSVQQAQNTLRVSTRLIDVRDGSTLWSNRYQRSTDDVFGVQREIASAVVTALSQRLGIAARAPVGDKDTADPRAFDLFLRGRYALRARGLDSLRAAVSRFREAVRLDSSFARAWAGIAEASALLPVYGGGGWDVNGASVRAAAQRAIALDSTLGAPHFALAMAAKGVGDWPTAETEFAQALARQPDLGAIHQNRGELLYTLGQVNDAAAALARAVTLEPQDAPIVSQFAGTLVISGQLDSAQRVLARAFALDSGIAFAYWSQMMLKERQGDARGALRAIVRAAELAPLPFFAGLRIRSAHRAGDAEGEEVARAALAAMRDAPGSALARALGDIDIVAPDTTLARLEQAVSEHDPLVWQLPFRLWWFDPIRRSSRFTALAQRLRLPPLAIAALPPAQR